MRKLYEKKEILFAVLWILAYCLVLSAIRGQFGDGSPWMVLALLAFAAGMTAFVKANRLEGKYGLSGWPRNAGRFLWFAPMLLLATGNLWDGFSCAYRGTAQLCAVLSMLLVGYVEELLFRGFLFRAMLPKDGARTAIIVSSATFGMGHIINLLTGQAGFETLVQIVFAVAWGFILTMAYFKSGKLLPCVLTHALVDVCSLFGADTELGDWLYVGATIVVSAVYCVYLSRLETPGEEPRSED